MVTLTYDKNDHLLKTVASVRGTVPQNTYDQARRLVTRTEPRGNTRTAPTT